MAAGALLVEVEMRVSLWQGRFALTPHLPPLTRHGGGPAPLLPGAAVHGSTTGGSVAGGQ